MDVATIPILKRLVPSLRKRRAEMSNPHAYRLIKRNGATFLVDYLAWSDRQTLIHGLVERPQTEFLLREITQRHASVFVDIGAHTGAYAIMVALHTTCGRIVAFEPDVRNFAHFQANLLVNRLIGKIETYPIAVSDEDGTAPFISVEPPYNVWSRIGGEPGNPTNALVQTCRLDSLLTLDDTSIALKIDVEGHELQVVDGMRKLLQDNSGILQIESVPERLPSLVTKMKTLGYEHIHSIAFDRYFARA